MRPWATSLTSSAVRRLLCCARATFACCMSRVCAACGCLQKLLGNANQQRNAVRTSEWLTVWQLPWCRRQQRSGAQVGPRAAARLGRRLQACVSPLLLLCGSLSLPDKYSLCQSAIASSHMWRTLKVASVTKKRPCFTFI